MYKDQIVCGEAASILSSRPATSVDLVVTDPPYLVNYHDRAGRTLLNDDNPEGVLSPEATQQMSQTDFARETVDSGPIYSCHELFILDS